MIETLKWKLELWWMKNRPELLIPYFREKEEEWCFHNLEEDREKLQKTIKHQRKMALKKLKLEEKKKEKKRCKNKD